jgi:hypothetical protein
VTIGLGGQPASEANPRRRLILLCVVLSVLSLLTACSHAATVQDMAIIERPDTQTAIHAWSTSGGQEQTSAVSRDLARIAATAAAADITGLRAACASLQTHVEAAQAYASIPDTVAQSHWSAALAQAALAAADCISFTQNLDPALLTRSGHELQAYDTEIDKLGARMDSLHPAQG